MTYRKLVCLSLLLGTTAVPCASAASLDRSELENFIAIQCRADESIRADLLFSPVERVPAAERTQGQSKWRLAETGDGYPDGRVRKKRGVAVRVDLALTLHATVSESEESYLWLAIAIPRAKQWKYAGHWPVRSERAGQFRGVPSDKHHLLIQQSGYSGSQGDFSRTPVYTAVNPQFVQRSRKLSRLWEEVFSTKLMRGLIYPAQNGVVSESPGYYVTLYHANIPALREIGENGYFWPVRKHVERTGKIFGFAFTPDGDCIATDFVDVVF